MSEPLEEVSKIHYLWHQRRVDHRLTGKSTEETCLPSVRCPGHRRHDFYSDWDSGRNMEKNVIGVIFDSCYEFA